MNVMDYITALRKHWIAILVLTILGATAGFAIGKLTPPTYQATSEIFVSVAAGDTVSELAQGSAFTQNIVQSYVQVAKTSAVLDPVTDNLNIDSSARHLALPVQV